jgi:hypothetical protein
MLWEYLVEWTFPKIWINQERSGARYVACDIELENVVWRTRQVAMRESLRQERIDDLGRTWID